MLLQTPDNEKQFQNIVKNGLKEVKKIRFICNKKWRKNMINNLQKLNAEFPQSQNLIHDLNIFVTRIHQEDLLKATMEIKPFRPCFQSVPLLKTTMTSLSINSKTKILSNSKLPKQRVSEYFKQQTLTEQFNKPYHPFNLIIKGFLMIQQKKYAVLAAKKNTSDILAMITQDLKILKKFLQLSSDIYLMVLKAEHQDEKKLFTKYLYKIVKEYVQQHQSINKFVIKAMRLSAKSQLKQLLNKIPQIVDIQSFKIPQQFQIGGCYIRAMNQLMTFSQTLTSTQSLAKLIEFRQAITQDIDSYYHQINCQQYRQITAQSQIQIIRFILCKVKNWIPEIYAQLKFLEAIYGQKQMGCNFDDASYMHCQISLSLQTLSQ